MTTTQPIKTRITALKEEYDRLRQGKSSLLQMIDEAEVPESVYNSNAIENSTLTLKETEKILLEMEVSRDVSLREVFEAKNLARVIEYIRQKSQQEEISKQMILMLHRMLMGNIRDAIAGRLRKAGEYVRVGLFIAPPPEHVERLIDNALLAYTSDHETYFVEKIATFHLEFETIHPFVDGNGRIGRVVVNYQLERLGFPPLIIQDKEKREYYDSFSEYRDSKKITKMARIVARGLMESLRKRIAYLSGMRIIPLAEHAKSLGKPVPVLLNAARRQTTPAFREKGVWKIGMSPS